MSNVFRLALAAVAAVALAVRLWMVIRYGDLRGFQGGDQGGYLFVSREFVRGHGFVRTWHGPGYPVFVSAARVITQVFGIPIRASVGLLQSFIGAGTVVLTGLMGRRLHSAGAGLIAAVVVAFLPSLVLATAVILSEVVFTCLLVATLYVLSNAEAISRNRLLAGGAMLGACVLTRPVAVPVAAALVWFVARGRIRTQPTGRVAGWVVLLGAIVVVWSPWFAHNLVQSGFVPLTTSGGYTLCIGNHDEAMDGAGRLTDACEPGTGNAVQDDRERAATAVRWIAGHPSEAFRLALDRIRIAASQDSAMVAELRGTDAVRPPAPELGRLQVTFDRARFVVFILGVPGLALLLRCNDSRWITVAWLLVMSVPMLGAFSDRYHQPIAPLVAIGAGASLCAAARPFAGTRDRGATCLERPRRRTAS